MEAKLYRFTLTHARMEADLSVPVASVWATVTSHDAGQVVIELAHPYPDLVVEPGDSLDGRRGTFEVESVGGRTLLCREEI
jgi:hypothetical protein